VSVPARLNDRDAQTAATTEFKVTRWSSVEYGTERPCEIARLTYKLGAHRYVALAFHYTEDDDAWRLTWLGLEGGDTARIPEGVYPSAAMLAALAVAPVEVAA
jgi:hypothetical protein